MTHNPMNDWDYRLDAEPLEDSAARWAAHFVTIGLLIIGWLILHFTASSALTAMVICLKFGWSDFRNAFWLRTTDPARLRAKATFWLYFSSGMWKTAIIGSLMSVLVVILVGVVGNKKGPQGQNAALDMFQGALITTGIALFLSTLTSIRAVWFARQGGVRLWLNSAIEVARKRNEWPPLYGHSNRAHALFLTALIVAYTVLLPMLALMISLFVQPKILAQFGGIIGLAWFGGLFSIGVIKGWLNRHVLANHPSECWDSAVEPNPHDLTLDLHHSQ